MGAMWLAWLAAVLSMIRITPSPVPGVLDLQRPTTDGWETYNNVVVLAEAQGIWNSSELNGEMKEVGPDTYVYRLDNGAHIQVSFRATGLRELTAEAIVLQGDVTKLSLSNDYGLATQIRYVVDGSGHDALAYQEPADGPGIMGAFYPVEGDSVAMIGNGLFMYQRTDSAVEGWMEVRRHPWLPAHTDPGHNWLERVHLTRAGGGEWVFGYSVNGYRVVVGGLTRD